MGKRNAKAIQIHKGAAVRPDKNFLQLHHRPLFPGHKESLQYALFSKSFRALKQVPHKILEGETIDEMIYNKKKQRDRLILELSARCGLRIAKSLNIMVTDGSDGTIILKEPKSGKEAKMAYMPENVPRKMVEFQ